jgi:hypothetical protein
MRFLRQKDLEADGISSSRAQTALIIQKYGFPRGKLITPNVRAYPEDEVLDWLANRPTETKPLGGAAAASHARKTARPQKDEPAAAEI